ncbi:MAG TPA: PQQ-dependent sugar dehydrogenase [Ktedonobacteraceae bacterium]|nr:PQQ-dependent sugar dehydrogenase [Ktedonobacteraceae bacterium]
MRWRQRFYIMFMLLCFLLAGCTSITTNSDAAPASTAATSGTTSVPGIHLPAGFHISVYAKGLSQPRFMTIGPRNVLLVANRKAGEIVALTPGSSNARAAQQKVIVSGLNSPTSVVLHAGYLYIGEANAIARVQLKDNLQAGPVKRILSLPDGGQHNTRTVLIGPDNRMYVSVGSTCNVCIEQDPHRAAVWVYNLDGSNGRLFAQGLRNAVGMVVNPWNQQIWVDVNGRDLMGDNTPPETLYHLIDGADYGWPRCHAGTIHDPQFGQAANACQGVQQPLEKMQAHSAPLGLAFPPQNAKQFPTSYRNSLYIAFHGSWNRTTPTGYKIVRIPLKNGQVAGRAQDFITGWLGSNGNVSGRPAGVTFAPDGTLFVSDDRNGNIYHIWYQA